MTNPLTSRDIQRVTFVESLHDSMKKQASEVIADHNRFVVLATSYIEDGLKESECVELLMIDGLGREAAESYAAMALSHEESTEEQLPQYNFRFEENGRIWSSYDIGSVVEASSDDDAWEKAQAILDDRYDDEHNLLSVNRM